MLKRLIKLLSGWLVSNTWCYIGEDMTCMEIATHHWRVCHRGLGVAGSASRLHATLNVSETMLNNCTAPRLP
jgi:hypothetical protein